MGDVKVDTHTHVSITADTDPATKQQTPLIITTTTVCDCVEFTERRQYWQYSTKCVHFRLPRNHRGGTTTVSTHGGSWIAVRFAKETCLVARGCQIVSPTARAATANEQGRSSRSANLWCGNHARRFPHYAIRSRDWYCTLSVWSQVARSRICHGQWGARVVGKAARDLRRILVYPSNKRRDDE